MQVTFRSIYHFNKFVSATSRYNHSVIAVFYRDAVSDVTFSNVWTFKLSYFTSLVKGPDKNIDFTW